MDTLNPVSTLQNNPMKTRQILFAWLAHCHSPALPVPASSTVPELVALVSARRGSAKVGLPCPPIVGPIARLVLAHRAAHARALASDPRRAKYHGDRAYRTRYAAACEHFARRTRTL